VKPLPDDFIEVRDRIGSAFAFAETVDLESDHPDLLSLKRVMADSTLRQSARRVVFVCSSPKGHSIAEVLKVDLGLVWVGRPLVLAGQTDRPRLVHGVERCLLLHPEHARGDGWLGTGCRCGYWEIPTPWIAEQVAGATQGMKLRRVPFPSTAIPEQTVVAGVHFDEDRLLPLPPRSQT
jgi:hypothetical protein